MSEPVAANGIATTAPILPPLYRSLEAVSAERHGRLRLRDAGLGFARTASAVPLTAEEFSVAARSLVIVFAAQAPHMPVALTGLTPETNLYVDSGGAWRIGAYVPAYLRRYPFFLLRVADGADELALCFDPTGPQVSEEAGEPMFTPEGKMAPQLERAFTFTKSVEEAMLRTRTMTTRLAEMGLLKPAVVEFERLGKPIRIDGFHAVDRPALAALPAEQLLELRERNWLEVIYAHLLSLGGLPELAGTLPPAAR
jgi:hypothetical protein